MKSNETTTFLKTNHVIVIVVVFASPQAGGSTEIVHCILAHLDILLPRCPGLYDEDFRLFYVRDNEPQNIKHAKVGA